MSSEQNKGILSTFHILPNPKKSNWTASNWEDVSLM